MTLVVGATGMLGSEICRGLAERAIPVSGLVRAGTEPSRLDKLRAQGVTLHQGDLKEHRTLETACAGSTTIISTASSTLSRQPGDSIQSVDEQGQLNLLAAAKASGVKHIVFISFPPMPEDFPLQRAKRRMESSLIASGLTYTILQPTFFMEVWLGPALGFDIAKGSVRIYGSGNNGISWISFIDVAKFAVAAIDNGAANDTVMELGGPQTLSPLEVVRLCEERAGHPFVVERVPEEALRAQKAAATDPVQESFAGLMLACAAGQSIDMRKVLEIFPVSLIGVEDYIKAVMSA
jgi:uncharacterized protein YbjT (DUF2867 family)